MPGLNPEMPLYKILEDCDPKHEIQLIECHDGALIMLCVDCPFHHVLNMPEEEVTRVRMDTNPLF